jgi:hypothetical protein
VTDESSAERADRSHAPSPLHTRALAVIGPRRYAIEGGGFASAPDEQSVWHIDLGAKPAPTCDCPAFISSLEDPQTCKHIPFIQAVDRARNAALYDRIFTTE